MFMKISLFYRLRPCSFTCLQNFCFPLRNIISFFCSEFIFLIDSFVADVYQIPCNSLTTSLSWQLSGVLLILNR